MASIAMVLSVTWALTLLYGEMFSFWVPSLWSCSWPHVSRYPSPSSSTNGGGGHPNSFVKVAVIADPQLMDRTSYAFPNSLAQEISQFYSDLYMRRAFLSSILPFHPDVILFLGDYFDGGPILSDEEWQESLSRFKHIFDLKTRRPSMDIPVYYICGNHDIGYSRLHSSRPKVVERYEKEFGTSNYRFTVGNVEFISVNAQALDGSSKNNPTVGSWGFIKNVSTDVKLKQRVLLTHVPLYRPDGTPCGPYRSAPIINQRIDRVFNGEDVMYQNYISEKSSNHLLDLIAPVLVLSGHDHDQCTVTHMSKNGPITEHTLGTVGWQQGNLYPSFMLLSASNLLLENLSSPIEAVATDLCFLPTQLHIYLWYISLFVITLLVLLLWPTNGLNFGLHLTDVIGDAKRLITQHFARVKEKNEDENCDYEMIWDAEGSMHLVKKALKVPPKSSNQTGFVESRGNAVMRQVAKKPEIDIDVGVDAIQPIPRTSKSKTKRVIQRFVRASRMLAVIAVVNVPLYMMLLFKDWIN